MTETQDFRGKAQTMSVQTSRAWFPGTYVPVVRLTAVEVLPIGSHRIEAAVTKGTVFHGTRAQILAAANALLRAVAVADEIAAQPAQ
jgi:hypothetical protein